MSYWPKGDLGDDCDGDLDGYDGGYSQPTVTSEIAVASGNVVTVSEFNDCARCNGTGLEPDGPGNGFHGTDYCKRCAGSGTRQDGPT